MIVEKQERDILRSSSFEEKTMGLAVGSEAFVFNVLRKDLYSDPIGSLIREYTVNAQDEHRKHGKADVPIFIQVPNQFAPELHIRDYAGGLTEEQVFNFFGNYGASDKRDSNVAVGFFGLGCKSAFAYTDSYIVKSYKDGMVHTFNIYIDETEIGKTAKIASEPTDEPNGVLIIVPVKTNDINTFQTKVIKTVNHFKVKPILKGLSYEPTYTDKRAIIKGEDWEFFGAGTPNVIMGEIAYPIDKYKMGNDLEEWESAIISSDIHIHVGIGDVQVTASREALQMNAKTIGTIRARIADIKDSMVTETQKAFDSAKTLIEAKTMYAQVINASGYSNILRKGGIEIKWKGEVLKDSYIVFDANSSHRILSYEYNRAKSQINVAYSRKLECNGNIIHFDDTDKAQIGYKRRARTLLDGGQKEVVVIETNDVADLEKVLGQSVKDFASFNAVVPTKATSASRSGYGTGVDLSKRAKHTSKMFVLNVDKLLRNDYSASSEVWDVKDVDLSQGGIYVPIERFKPTNIARIYNLEALATFIRKFKMAGMSINVPIYGLKKDTPTDGLVKFDDWMKAKVEANVKLIREYSLAKAFDVYDLVDASHFVPKKLPHGSVAKAYANAYRNLKNNGQPYADKFKILNLFPVQTQVINTIKELSEKFKAKYPMLTYVSVHHYGKNEIANYIAEREGEVS